LYEFEADLGEGAFGQVKKATFKPTGEIMAVKMLKAERATDQVMQLFRQEADLLSQFDHPNIIKIHHLILLKN